MPVGLVVDLPADDPNAFLVECAPCHAEVVVPMTTEGYWAARDIMVQHAGCFH